MQPIDPAEAAWAHSLNFWKHNPTNLIYAMKTLIVFSLLFTSCSYRQLRESPLERSDMILFADGFRREARTVEPPCRTLLFRRVWEIRQDSLLMVWASEISGMDSLIIERATDRLIERELEEGKELVTK